ncbi:hypothetical protein [Brevundimonas sp.]
MIRGFSDLAVSPAKAGAQGHTRRAVIDISLKPSWTPAFAGETGLVW